MVEADRMRYERVMATLASVYGALSPLRLDAYWMALAEYPIGDIEQAALRCLMTRTSRIPEDGSGPIRAPWPTPADLIGLLYGGDGQAEQRPTRRALPAAPPDPETQERIRQLIRETIASLPDGPSGRRPAERGDNASPDQDPASRIRRLRALLHQDGATADLIGLALRAGYSRAEVADALESRP